MDQQPDNPPPNRPGKRPREGGNGGAEAGVEERHADSSKSASTGGGAHKQPADVNKPKKPDFYKLPEQQRPKASRGVVVSLRFVPSHQ